MRTTSLMQKLIHTTIRKRKTNLSLSPSPFHFVWCRQMSQQCGHAECLVTEMLNFKKQMHSGLNCYSIQWHGFGDTSFCFRSSVHFLLALTVNFKGQPLSNLLNTLPRNTPSPQTCGELPRPEPCAQSQKHWEIPLNWWPGSPNIRLLMIHVNPMSTRKL